ncbi:MAG: alpha/beta hydrolase fold protein [Nevskia sp.]|nr:alpha/beta hydrolase fold protein [Nevskia sp.]
MSSADPFVESRLQLAGFNTRALQSATGRGHADITLVLLHGWGDSADTFKPLLRQLAAASIGGVALDLPHCGHADDLRPGPHLPQFVAFTRAAIEHYGGRVVPIGQSLGGRAMLMALAAGVRADVPACIAIAPAPLELPPWQKMLVRNAALAQGVSALGKGQGPQRLIDDFVQSFRRTCFVSPQTIPQQVYLDYASHYDAARVQRHFGALRQIGEELAAPLDFDGLSMPVELIWGAHDRLAPLISADRYLQALPQTRLTVLENCGHHAHLERVDAVAQILQSRLAQL